VCYTTRPQWSPSYEMEKNGSTWSFPWASLTHFKLGNVKNKLIYSNHTFVGFLLLCWDLKGTPLRSGRVTHLKKNFLNNLYFVVTNVFLIQIRIFMFAFLFLLLFCFVLNHFSIVNILQILWLIIRVPRYRHIIFKS